MGTGDVVRVAIERADLVAEAVAAGVGRTVEPLDVVSGDLVCRGGSICQGDGTCEPGDLFCAACLPSVNGRWV